MTNQEKRTLLRGVYRSLAQSNDIAFPLSDLSCSADCDGTCPACQAQLRALEEVLNRRAAEGTPIVLTGIAAETECAPAAPVAEVVTPAVSRLGSYLDMSLEELGLSLRTRVSLDGHGITCVRQLLDMSPSDLKKVRNMTQEGLDEIEYQMGLLGLNLEQDL